MEVKQRCAAIRITSYNVCYTKLLRKQRQIHRNFYNIMPSGTHSLHYFAVAQTISAIKTTTRSRNYLNYFHTTCFSKLFIPKTIQTTILTGNNKTAVCYCNCIINRRSKGILPINTPCFYINNKNITFHVSNNSTIPCNRSRSQ